MLDEALSSQKDSVTNTFKAQYDVRKCVYLNTRDFLENGAVSSTFIHFHVVHGCRSAAAK